MRKCWENFFFCTKRKHKYLLQKKIVGHRYLESADFAGNGMAEYDVAGMAVPAMSSDFVDFTLPSITIRKEFPETFIWTDLKNGR